jgi:hypothetical protein
MIIQSCNSDAPLPRSLTKLPKIKSIALIKARYRKKYSAHFRKILKALLNQATFQLSLPIESN